MSDRNFRELLEARWDERKVVCVGLDSELKKIPESVHQRCHHNVEDTIVQFNRAIVEMTHDVVQAYKPNIAFYAAEGREGLTALRRTIEDIHAIAPNVSVILDYKLGDIGNTNNGYVRAAFEHFGADAVTVNPYFGAEALQPFLDRAEKGIIILCRTSNPGASEFQDLIVEGEALFYHVARHVVETWNKLGNCALVTGTNEARNPGELLRLRQIAPNLPFLVPGLGAQQGDVEQTVTAAKDSRGQGAIYNSSRGIIFASGDPDFAQAARLEATKLHDQIRACIDNIGRRQP